MKRKAGADGGIRFIDNVALDGSHMRYRAIAGPGRFNPIARR